MKKYTPKTKQELQTLVDDESIYLGDIDTSLITDMSDLFLASERKDFKGIESWNTSKVENMESMFSYAKYFNEDISTWDVTNTYYFSNMFYCATSFNQDLSKWNINVDKKYEYEYMSEYAKDMFYGAKSFKQDISTWKNWKSKTRLSILDDNVKGSGIDKEYKGVDFSQINPSIFFCLYYERNEFYAQACKKAFSAGCNGLTQKEKRRWIAKNKESFAGKFLTKRDFNHLHTQNLYFDVNYVKYFIYKENFRMLLVIMEKRGYRVVGEYIGCTKKYNFQGGLDPDAIKHFKEFAEILHSNKKELLRRRNILENKRDYAKDKLKKELERQKKVNLKTIVKNSS